MKKILPVVIVALLVNVAWSLDFDPFQGPKPIAILIQTDPWRMVIDSDTPMTAIYDDGRVVYLKREKTDGSSYVSKRLTTEELGAVELKLASFGDFSKLKRGYNLAPNVTDQPETKIYLNLGNKEFVTTVYGLKMSPTELPTHPDFRGEPKPDELPVPIRQVHEYLRTLDYKDSTPWESPYVEVIIWAYEYAPAQSIQWPKDWPGLRSPNTLKRGGSYSIFLPSKELPRLRDFLKTRKEKGAVEIDGKKWAVSVRFAFPSEPVWINAFRKRE
ncbi:MAG: hypothetical protein WBN92_07300 [Terriglobia bacterium]